MVDLDRGQPQPGDARDASGLADQARERVPGGAVPVAAEVDPRQDDLAVPLIDAALDLGEHGRRGPAARFAADERHDAERAGEAAAVLHLHERADAVDAGIGLNAADRPDRVGDEVGSCLAPPPDDGDVVGKPREAVRGQVGAAAGDEDAPMGARRARCGVPRLAHRLVRDAAGIDDGHVCAVAGLVVTVSEQALADLLRIGIGDLAAQESNRERAHVEPNSTRGRPTSRPPSRPTPAARRGGSALPRGRSVAR